MFGLYMNTETKIWKLLLQPAFICQVWLSSGPPEFVTFSYSANYETGLYKSRILFENIHLPTILIASLILSNSSGQISGQCVKPKYRRTHLPLKSLSDTALPVWSVKLNGPPRETFPIERWASFFFSAKKLRIELQSVMSSFCKCFHSNL